MAALRYDCYERQTPNRITATPYQTASTRGGMVQNYLRIGRWKNETFSTCLVKDRQMAAGQLGALAITVDLDFGDARVQSISRQADAVLTRLLELFDLYE